MVVIVLDQITKFLTKNYLELKQSIPIIQNIFHLSYHQNTGAGFSILQGQQALLIFISIFAVGLILFHLDKIKKNQFFVQIATGLILGGTIGNLIDRISYGYVIDFLDFRIWPIFNIADSALTVGVVMLCWYIIKQEKKS